MSLFNFASWLRQTFPRTAQPVTRARRKSLQLEALEDRLTPSTFTVLDNSDSATDPKALRYALTNVASLSITSIDFDPSVRSITLSNNGNSTGLIVANNLTITNDQGTGPVTIDGANLFTVFTIHSGVTATVSGLTIQHGYANNTLGGGAIQNAGNLTLTNDSILNSTAQGGGGGGSTYGGGGGGAGLGGGVYNSGTLDVQGSTFSGDQALGGAGGGYFYNGNNGGTGGGPNGGAGAPGGGSTPGGDGGEASGGGGGSYGSSASGDGGKGGLGGGGGGGTTGGVGGFGGGKGGSGVDYAGGGGGAGLGGAIFNDVGGTTVVANSTFSGDGAQGGAGGSNYYAGGGGGAGLGAAIFSAGGTVSITSSTLAGNAASSGAGGASYNIPSANGSPGLAGGGGVYVYAGTVTVDSSIIAKNTVAGPGANSDPDVAGAFTDAGYNLIYNVGDSTSFTQSTDIVGQDPQLSPPANNGGPTQTMALSPTSPALEKGDPSNGVSVDQRGYPRPQYTAPSIGAFEQTLVILSGGQTVTAVEGSASTVQTVASFPTPRNNDVNFAHYTATIDWGDSHQSPGSFALSMDGQTIYVQGSHTYDEEGTYTVSVSVVDADSPVNTPPSTATSSATVSDAALAATAVPITAAEGQPVSNVIVATFTDADPKAVPADYNVTVAWGDGETSPGTVTAVGGTFQVTASKPHPYAEEGSRTVTVTIIDTDAGAVASESWVSVAPLPTAAGELKVVEGSDGRLYAIGGYTNASLSNAVYAYTPSTNTWTPAANMSTGRADFGAVEGPDGRIYAIGGFGNGGRLTSVEAYSPDTNTWTSVASLPIGLGALSAATGADGRIYAIGGDDGAGISSSVYAYTPSTNQWTQVAALPDPLFFAAATTGADGRIYVVGGNDASTNQVSNKVFAYTPSTNQWTQVASMPTGLEYLSAATGADGQIYAIGGYDSSNQYTSAVYVYTPSTDQWAQLPASLSSSFYFAAAATGADARVYVVGGYDPNNGYSRTATVEALGQPRGVATTTSNISVSDPAVIATAGQSVVNAVAGGSTNLVLLATFTDPAGAETIGDYSATVDWGDGTAGTPDKENTTDANPNVFIVQDGNRFLVEGTHVYATAGDYTITTTIHHDVAPDAVVQEPVVVASTAQPPLSATGGFTYTATEGLAPTTTQTVATFTDPSGAALDHSQPSPTPQPGVYAATVSWGDGSAPDTTATITVNAGGLFTVSGSHQYAEDGTYTISALLQRTGSPNVTVTSTALVGDQPLTSLILSTLPTTGVVGTGIGVGGQTVATFTDSAGFGKEVASKDFTSVINWGDGSTSPGTVSQGVTNGAYVVTAPADHTYTAAGNHTISVTVTHDTEGPIGVSQNISVAKDATVVAWAQPADLTYGTPLGASQLDATATAVVNGTLVGIAGTYTYTLADGSTPASGALLHAGSGQTLKVTFAPTDSADYATTTGTTILNVNPAVSTITWAPPAGITYGTALGAAQLDAVISTVLNGTPHGVPGTFTYTLSDGVTPAVGAVLHAGQSQTLRVTFTPATADYTNAAFSTTINVGQATPTLSWPTPADVTFGTPLGASQLDATATAVVNGASTSVAGTFTYTLADGVTPAGGVVLNVGNGQTLKVTFTPTDSADFIGAATATTLNVNSPLQISQTSLPAGTAGSAYTQTITVSGGTAPYRTFSVTAFNGGTTGLTAGAVVANALAGTVIVSGTPTGAGALSFTLNVTDSGGAALSRTYTLTVAPVVTASTSALIPSATTLTIHGVGFDANPVNDQVVFTGGAKGTVTAATTTTLTVTGLSGLTGGPLLATVTVDGSAAAPVRVATVAPVVAAVLMTDGSLIQYVSGNFPKLLSPAGTILAVATALDGNGLTDIFAITTAGRNVWEYTPTAGWSELSTGSFQQLSAATNAAGQAMVFGVLTDGSLWQQDPALGTGLNVGWTSLSAAGSIQSVSAVTDAAGNDVVYAITQTPGYVGHVWEYSPSLPGHWQQLSTGTFQQVSAGLNGAGQAVVYGVLADGSLWEQNPVWGTGLNVGWHSLPAAGTILAVSAGGPDKVFAIQSDHHLWEHSASLPGNGWALASGRLFSSISATQDAAGQDDVFATLTDASFYEYTAGISSSTLQEILAGGVASSSTPTGRAG